MAQRYRFGFAVLLALSLLPTGMAAGWGDLIASPDDMFAAGSDDLSATADLLSPSLALPVAIILLTAPVLVMWHGLVAQQPQKYTPVLTPVQVPRAPPV